MTLRAILMDNHEIIVSVIIPCFNHGIYLDEAVNSVLAQTFQKFEIIIINDGSTDAYTNELLTTYIKPKTRVINTENRGLAHARNLGISEANGKYILPLDADDKIAKTYLEKAVDILSNSSVGIVYCMAEYFYDSGLEAIKWELPEYSISSMLIDNIIFCSALFRKSDWAKSNGYDPNLGALEDYDFWLSLIELGLSVFRIEEVLFHYRQRPNSMIHSISPEMDIRNRAYIVKKHSKLYRDNYDLLYDEIRKTSKQLASASDQLMLINGELEYARRSLRRIRKRERKSWITVGILTLILALNVLVRVYPNILSLFFIK